MQGTLKFWNTLERALEYYIVTLKNELNASPEKVTKEKLEQLANAKDAYKKLTSKNFALK
ncbi:MAG: hypothetical protein ACI4WZ_07305 [Eubacteriales bacterium]